MPTTNLQMSTLTAGTRLECLNLEVQLPGSGGSKKTVLRDVNLKVERGEFVSILGTSGAGKTTLLRVLGGLQRYSSGVVSCEGRRVSGPPSGVVTVFQDYAQSLLPWRTVRRNVGLGIERRLSRVEVRSRVDEALELVGLEDIPEEFPRRLSGGMQQRVQIARALAMRPSVLLMDEPFGALDALTKASLQDQLLKVQAATRATVVFVTHDVDEAVYLSDRAIVLVGRPASFESSVAIDLPRPRDQLATKESPSYLKYRREIYETLVGGGSTVL